MKSAKSVASSMIAGWKQLTVLYHPGSRYLPIVRTGRPEVHHVLALFLLILAPVISSIASENRPSRPDERPRSRDLGIRVGMLPTGDNNAITDVRHVRVGHRTLIEGAGVRTGVTVILPHDGNIFQSKVPAAIYVGNGFGKLIGVTQVRELGVIESPIALTNTLSSFTVADALVRHTLGQPENRNVRSVNPVVGECNDGYLNDIRGLHVRAEHVFDAIDSAKSGLPAEGSVGAGTGTRCFGWKGGIGTASRVLPKSAGGYTVGVLVQTNFNGVLSIAGAPVGQELGSFYLRQETDQPSAAQDEGSCMIVVATDAPLDSRQLGRLAKRALLGLAAAGSPMTNGSGDYVIAFSSNESVRVPYESADSLTTRTVLRDERISPLFQAVREATEESILNSLLRATTIEGIDGHQAVAIPVEAVVRACQKFGVITPDAGQ